MCRGIPFILSELFCRFKPAKEPAFLVVTDYDSDEQISALGGQRL